MEMMLSVRPDVGRAGTSQTAEKQIKKSEVRIGQEERNEGRKEGISGVGGGCIS